MRYLGSKARFAKALLAIMCALHTPGQTYVEPFMGGANIFDKAPGPKIGADSNTFLVALWRAVQDGWTPPENVSQAEYEEARAQATLGIEQRTLPDALIGFVGAGCSFGGKWFGGYARGGFNKDGPRVHSRESAKAVAGQRAGLIGATLVACSYADLVIPAHSLIYCDPPYSGTTGYKQSFDSEAFWCWAEQKCADGHTVFVSEYAAPLGWECVWEAETHSSVTKESRGSKTAVERLWRCGM